MTIDLEAIKIRCKAATPGPWYMVGPPWRATYYDRDREIYINLGTHIVAGNPDPHIGKSIIDSIEMTGWDFEAWKPDCSQSDADLEFCAYARTDIPALIAEIERLRDELELHEELYIFSENDMGMMKAQRDGARDTCASYRSEIEQLRKLMEAIR